MRALMSAPPSSPLRFITLKGFKSKKFLPHHIILASAVQQIKLAHFLVLFPKVTTDSGLELHFPLPEVSKYLFFLFRHIRKSSKHS